MIYRIYKVYLRLIYRNNNNFKYLDKLAQFIELRKKWSILLTSFESNSIHKPGINGASIIFSNWYQKKFLFHFLYIIIILKKLIKTSSFFNFLRRGTL